MGKAKRFDPYDSLVKSVRERAKAFGLIRQNATGLSGSFREPALQPPVSTTGGQTAGRYRNDRVGQGNSHVRVIDVGTGQIDFMFNLTGIVGLGAFAFMIYAIVYLDVPESNKEVWIHLIGICEGIVLSIFSYFFGAAVRKNK